MGAVMASVSVAEARRFVSSLNFKVPAHIHRGGSRSDSTPDDPSTVDAGSVVSFVGSIDGQVRSDVLNSTLLAQLWANQNAQRDDDAEAWYKTYFDTLGHIGWVLQAKQFNRYEGTGESITMDQAVLGIISAIATQNELAAIKATLDALNSLANDDHRIVLFDKQSHSGGHGNFQIAACTVTDGSPALKLGAFYFSTTEVVDRFLWFSFANSTIQIYNAVQSATLDTDLYAQIRQDVLDKLAGSGKDYLAGIQLKHN
jgi:hypothetical protein